MENPLVNALLAMVLGAVLALGGWQLGAMARRRQAAAAAASPAPTPPGPVACTPVQRVRQFLRRWAWGLLFVPGIVLYPLAQQGIVRLAVGAGNTRDVAQRAAAEAAKLVDFVQVYSKLSVGVGVFCLVNLLAWGALNLVMPALPDWAVGRYKTPQADYPVVPGFKGTFLRLGDAQRLAFYFVGLGLELLAAWGSIDAAFRMQ